QLESVCLNDFVHPHRQRQVIGRELEERIPTYVDFVEKNPRQKRRQSERLPICDEVDFVSSFGEGNTQLCRDGSGAAVRRVARDANLHSALSHHSRTTALARESSGFTRVTAAAGS